MQSNSSKLINIDSDDRQVKIDFRYINRHGLGGWVTMNPNCYIRPAGSDLNVTLLEAIGIPLAPKKITFRKQGGLLYYTLIFPPLESHISEIDIIEDSDNATSFNFYNIPLRLIPMSLTNSKNTVLKKIENLALALKATSNETKSYFDELSRLEEPLSELSDFLKLDNEEVAVFSLALYLTLNSDSFCMAELRNFSRFTTYDIYQIRKIIKALVKKGWLVKGEKTHFVEKLFTVPQKHMEALYKNACPDITKKDVDVYVATDYLHSCIRAHCDEDTDTDEMLSLITEYEEDYPDINPFKIAKDLNLNTTEKLLLYFTAAKTYIGEEVINIDRMLVHLFKTPDEKRSIKKMLASSNSVLFTEKYIEFVNDDFKTDKQLKLSKDASVKLFGEDACFLSQEVDFKSGICKVIKHETIKEKALFYNDSENLSISSVTAFLQAENFDAISKRLEENKMSPGLTILLHGYPGTGKTETIYQLARQTKRHILLVNISEIRDKYVGESEKRLKAVFETYKNSFKHFDQIPILLFNESDALIGKRINVESSVDQMNNAMQNILLQELEDFKGILMATTNLTSNLDDAFERRFLFKIKYSKPSMHAKISIWKSKLSFLSGEDAKRLAEEFDFSGGQIENISRKLFLDTVLLGKSYTIEDTIQYCAEEILLDRNKTKIGF